LGQIFADPLTAYFPGILVKRREELKWPGGARHSCDISATAEENLRTGATRGSTAIFGQP
jgi:hypothetical protein